MAKLLTRAGFLVAALVFVACGSVATKDDAAPNPADAGPIIDSAPLPDTAATIDAAPGTPDARPPAQGPPSQEITSAGTRVTGGGYTVDVQLGHWYDQGPVSGGGASAEGGAAIKE